MVGNYFQAHLLVLEEEVTQVAKRAEANSTLSECKTINQNIFMYGYGGMLDKLTAKWLLPHFIRQ